MLSPLRVETESTTRRENAERIEETRRLRAYAFSLEDVTVPAIPFAGKPLDGGELEVAATRPFSIRVRPALDAAAPGPPDAAAVAPGADGRAAAGLPADPVSEAVSALISLGLKPQEASRRIAALDEPHDVAPEELVRRALRAMAG